uniref:Uncharacterized protein n=1 Tax=Setaria italica TaxID=4555 RepID=K3YNT7_SETIT
MQAPRRLGLLRFARAKRNLPADEPSPAVCRRPPPICSATCRLDLVLLPLPSLACAPVRG